MRSLRLAPPFQRIPAAGLLVAFLAVFPVPSRADTPLDTLTLVAMPDPENLRVRIHARRSAGEQEFACDFEGTAIPGKSGDARDVRVTFHFPPGEGHSDTFFSLDAKVRRDWTVRGNFRRGREKRGAPALRFSASGDTPPTASDKVPREGAVRRETFDAFWSDTLEEVRKIDPAPHRSPNLQFSRDGLIVEDVSFDSLGGARIHGWLIRREGAADEGARLPGMLIVHGYRMLIPYPITDYGANIPCVTLQIDLRGCGGSTAPGRTGEEYILDGIDSPRAYIYRGAVADCVQGVRFLSSLPFVDPSRIIVNGGSQGGGLALLTASLLGGELAAVIADEPFLTGFPAALAAATAGPYRTLREWLARNPSREARARRTLELFDTANHARRIRVPVYVTIGGRDTICPPAAIQTLVERLPRDLTEVRVYPDAAHSVLGPAYFRDKIDWLRRTLERR